MIRRRKMRGCTSKLDAHGHHRAACSGVVCGHWKALHDQIQDGLPCMFRRLLGVMSSIDMTQIPTHGAANNPAGVQLEQGDIYLKLPENGHLASLCGGQELVVDFSRVHTHTKTDVSVLDSVGNRPTAHLRSRADKKYGRHAKPYQRLHIA